MSGEEQSARERWLALSQDEQDAINAEKKARGELPIPTHREWPQIQVGKSLPFTFYKPDGSVLMTSEGEPS